MFRVNKIDIKLILGFFTGIVLLYQLLPMKELSKRFEEFALGTGTTVFLGRVNDVKIHCHDLVDAEECLQDYELAGFGQPVLLWLGNSQLHAINQFKPGEETAAPEMHRMFQVRSEYFLTLSQPNANLQEHYLFFSYLLNKLPIKRLVLPVVFDDMREDGIRRSLLNAFKEQKTLALLSKTKIGRSLIANHGEQHAAGNEMAALQDTLQERSEKTLNSMLEETWFVWAERPTLRGTIVSWLYQFRNRILGINPSSTRKMIKGRYLKNRDAFLAILKLAALKKVQVLVYVVPLRNDVKPPYDPQEYASFKLEMASLTLNNDARFVDFEKLVPTEFWGVKGATAIGEALELDFMHFQEGGHRLLAEALYRELTAQGLPR